MREKLYRVQIPFVTLGAEGSEVGGEIEMGEYGEKRKTMADRPDWRKDIY